MLGEKMENVLRVVGGIKRIFFFNGFFIKKNQSYTKMYGFQVGPI